MIDMAGKAKFKIETPRGSVVHIHHKDGIVEARLKWNQGFGARYRKSFSTAQDYIDAECLRLCEPKVPMDTKTLIKSGILCTYIGSGEIRYKTPYARIVYRDKKRKYHGAPERGPLFFARMKQQHSTHLRNMAKRLIASGK